jgi:hypothetical protein
MKVFFAKGTGRLNGSATICTNLGVFATVDEFLSQFQGEYTEKFNPALATLCHMP